MSRAARHNSAVESPDAVSSSLRFWYGAAISEFLSASPDAVLGQLTKNCAFTLMPTQTDAWLVQIAFLHSKLVGLSGSIFLEFNIPRLGPRIAS